MTTTKKRRNYQKEVAEKLIGRIKSGGLLPWECPWERSSAGGLLPTNHVTKTTYSGLNLLTLWAAAAEKGYSSNLWMTAKQARSLGTYVRKGEKAVMCVRYGLYDKKVENEETGEEETALYAFSVPFYLFNIEQIEGIEVELEPDQPEETDPDQAVTAINELAQQLSVNSGLNLTTTGNSAYYHPLFDRVNMPARKFKSSSGYVATLAHELTHCTGHQKRLNRFGDDQGSFGTKKEEYAYEELIAEMGSAFVCGELGVQGTHEQHASYLDSWLKSLDSDYRFLTRAASAASKAHALIMSGGVLDADLDTVKAAQALQRAA